MLTTLSVCEDMFQLNVLNRVRRNPYREVTYALKNALVEYLYQRGYCIEALLHCQKFECWSCDGTGEYMPGETCYKCDGTGVYREVWHYAFRFEVQGRRFSWHQPKSMVDFPVALTPGLPEMYKDPALPPKNETNLFYQRAEKSIWNIALYLWLRGKLPARVGLGSMPILRDFYLDIRSFYYRRIWFDKDTLRARLRAWLNHEPYDEPPF